MYAIFNHQIADLPNPQSPYKKDNPKTWGDGTLIDFGDGTAGIAKKLDFNKTSAKNEIRLYLYTDKEKVGETLDWGGTLYVSATESGNSVSWPAGAYNYYEPDNVLVVLPDISYQPSGYGQISITYTWSKGTLPTEKGVPDSLWVWIIFEYSHA